MTGPFTISRVLLLLGCAFALAGCGIELAPVSKPGSALAGRVHGGQQPVSGASIKLYAAGLSGNGTGAVDLLAAHTITSDAGGNFTITGDYTCPTATTPVYLVARGGNPGLAPGTSNQALVLMAALGDCGTLSASTGILVDEVTTVAAAWALAQFFGQNAEAGASATNVAGLRNAFAVAANLANTPTGTAPGALLPAGAVVEARKLNALANVIGTCVNSEGSTACAPLFSAAPSSPANTFDAALTIVRNPAVNIAQVFNVAGAAGPFQPALTAAPHDWTMSITYGNCLSGCGGLSTPTALAVDSTGSVWVANYNGGSVSKLSAAGVPAAAQGFAGVGLRQSYGLAIDAGENAWVTNEQSVDAASNGHNGSVSRFTSAGVELSGAGYTGGGIYYPVSIAADSAGPIWVADRSDSSATLLASDGSGLSGSSGYAASQLPFPSAVALDAGRNAWFAVQGAAVRVTPIGAASTFSCCSRDPTGIAIDAGGNIWLADYGAYSIVELSAAGAIVRRVSTAAGPTSPLGIAIDGTGNVWTGNYYGNSVTELVGSTGKPVSMASGFGLDAGLHEPYGIALDASGNVWLTNSGDFTVTQLVGLASPVKTPLLGPVTPP